MSLYQHSKVVTGFSRRGQILADRAVHAIVSARYPRAYAVKDAAAKSKTLDALRDELRERRFFFELVYDATHGRRYIMMIFTPSVAHDSDVRLRENQGARKLAFDFLCAPEHTYFMHPSP